MKTLPVKLRIADAEPFSTFLAAASSALGLFADADMDALPAGARAGVAELRSACELLGVTIPSREAPDDAYRGVVIIEWPAPYGAGPYSAMHGGGATITDAVTGALLATVSRAVVTSCPAGLVTAELTMLADADGDPLPDGPPAFNQEETRTGTFTFLVTEMRVRDR
jgi:hypothetical protein